MGFVIPFLILQVVVVGIAAQKWKARTGAVWVLVAICVNVAWVYYMSGVQEHIRMNMIMERKFAEYNTIEWEYIFVMFYTVPQTIILAIIVATLPRIKK